LSAETLGNPPSPALLSSPLIQCRPNELGSKRVANPNAPSEREGASMGELDTDTIGLFVTLAGLAAVFVAAKLQRRAGRRPRMPSP